VCTACISPSINYLQKQCRYVAIQLHKISCSYSLQSYLRHSVYTLPTFKYGSVPATIMGSTALVEIWVVHVSGERWCFLVWVFLYKCPSSTISGHITINLHAYVYMHLQLHWHIIHDQVVYIYLHWLLLPYIVVYTTAGLLTSYYSQLFLYAYMNDQLLI